MSGIFISSYRGAVSAPLLALPRASNLEDEGIFAGFLNGHLHHQTFCFLSEVERAVMS